MNKKVLIVGVIALVLLLGGGFFVLSSRNNAPVEEDVTTDTIQSLSPEDIGLSLVAREDKKAVKIVVEKTEDLQSLEYEITYEADIPESELPEGETGGRVERGFSGEEQVTPGKTYESKFLDLGSCSRNVCRYDTNVEEVAIMMKVTKKDGKIYQVEDTLSL